MAERPPASAIPVARRSYRSTRNEAVSAIPPHVLAIFENAGTTGDTSRQTRFYKSARILDSRLDAVCATRTLAVQGRPVVWKPPPGFEGDTEAKRIAENVSRLWNSTRRTVPALGHLAHGVLEGHAGLALEWVTDKLTGWHRPEFLIEHSQSEYFIWDPDVIEPWFSVDSRAVGSPSDTAFPLRDRPDQFIFFSPVSGRADYPWRRGALRACVIRSLLKRLNIGHWSALLERWGQPQVVAIVDYDTARQEGQSNQELEDEILSMLRDIGSDWRASMPKGVELVSIPVTVAEQLHKLYVDWANTEDAIAILGQNLSTEAQGGSFAAAAAHNRIRNDILAADCLELAEALTDQWAEPVVRHNWPGSPVPYAEFVLAPKRELTTAEYQVGLYTADEVRMSQGHEAEPDGRGRRYFGASNPTAGSPTADEPSKPSDTGEPGANLSH